MASCTEGGASAIADQLIKQTMSTYTHVHTLNHAFFLCWSHSVGPPCLAHSPAQTLVA